jgi:hypothetical protein
VDRGGHCEKDIEYLTGGIPLYLKECIVNGKIDLDQLAGVGTKAATFTADTRRMTKDQGDSGYWQLYGPPYLLYDETDFSGIAIT